MFSEIFALEFFFESLKMLRYKEASEDFFLLRQDFTESMSVCQLLEILVRLKTFLTITFFISFYQPGDIAFQLIYG